MRFKERITSDLYSYKRQIIAQMLLAMYFTSTNTFPLPYFPLLYNNIENDMLSMILLKA